LGLFVLPAFFIAAAVGTAGWIEIALLTWLLTLLAALTWLLATWLNAARPCGLMFLKVATRRLLTATTTTADVLTPLLHSLISFSVVCHITRPPSVFTQ
jgi:hypothetical protein